MISKRMKILFETFNDIGSRREIWTDWVDLVQLEHVGIVG